jgi:5-methylcytosine-specific restriction protein A
MPRRAPSACPVPGCPELTQGGRCHRHRQERTRAQDQVRGSAHDRLYGSRWRRYSQHYLRLHPLCGTCQANERTTPSEVTDHVEPHRGDPARFWDPTNHQALCKRCHDRKTAGEVNRRTRDRKPPTA